MKPALFFLILILARPVFAFSVSLNTGEIQLGDTIVYWFEGTNNYTIKYTIETNGVVVRPKIATTFAGRREYTPKKAGEYSIIAKLGNKSSIAKFSVVLQKQINQQAQVSREIYTSSNLAARVMAKDILLGACVLLCCGMLWKII